SLPKREHISEVMKLVKITEVQDRIIKNLSKGYKQRVGFAQALLGNPPVLILDEPTVGLDPKQIIEIRTLIKNLGKKHTVIFSSHVLSEISATCDRIIVISNGTLVADAKTSELSTSISGEQKLSLEIEGSQNTVLNGLKNIQGVIRVKKQKDTSDTSSNYIVEYQNGFDIRREVFNAMARNNCPILSMQSGNETLEESFLRLISQDQTQKTIGGRK
ncbi:MAG: ABC transporter ATP-binding protein, partial [Oscillospiraceae bacterium]|nr:ABC transporter ATP-binding protein [Oscillospiraceae bacterium]